jgi:hypothetical protein
MKYLDLNVENVENVFNEYFVSIKNRPSDINPILLLSWAKELKMRWLIEDNVLYSFAEYCGQTILWGPPVGDNLSLEHIEKAFYYLKANKCNNQGKILYIWNEYDLWQELKKNERYLITFQSQEYLYPAENVKDLKGNKYKNIRHDAKKFVANYTPKILEYSAKYKTECVDILNKWKVSKGRNIQEKYHYKMVLEYEACKHVLTSDIPLNGVTAWVNNKMVSFSIGCHHDEKTFCCLFEKTDPAYKNASSVIFQELAKFCIGKYEHINAGEDWGIEYLTRAKNKWRPIIKNIYSLSLNNHMQ